VTVTRIDNGVEWRDERLYVLNMIEDFKQELRRQADARAVDHQYVEVKGKRDIHEAHEKIRALEKSGSMLRIQNWIMTVVLGAAGAIAFEFVKAWLHGWKP